MHSNFEVPKIDEILHTFPHIFELKVIINAYLNSSDAVITFINSESQSESTIVISIQSGQKSNIDFLFFTPKPIVPTFRCINSCPCVRDKI